MQIGQWSKENFERLEGMLEGPPGIAAFDFDNTLIYNDLGEAVMYYIIFQGLVRADREDFWRELEHPIIPQETIAELRGHWDASNDGEDQTAYLKFADGLLNLYARIARQIGLESAYRWTRVIFGGHTVKELKNISKHVFEYELSREIGTLQLPSGLVIDKGIRVYEEIRELISALWDKGWAVRIVTASPEPLIKAVIPEWGLPSDCVKGMRLVSDPDEPDLLLPVLEEPMTFGPGKVIRLEPELSKTNLPLRFAAGDSWTDFNMLLHAENAVLIDRGNQELIRRAIQSGFWVQERFLQTPGGAPSSH